MRKKFWIIWIIWIDLLVWVTIRAVWIILAKSLISEEEWEFGEGDAESDAFEGEVLLAAVLLALLMALVVVVVSGVCVCENASLMESC